MTGWGEDGQARWAAFVLKTGIVLKTGAGAVPTTRHDIDAPHRSSRSIVGTRECRTDSANLEFVYLF